MVRLAALTPAVFQAIVDTLPGNNFNIENERAQNGDVYVWLDHGTVPRLKAMRGRRGLFRCHSAAGIDRGWLMLSPRLTAREESAFALAEGVLTLANNFIDAVTPDVIIAGAARSPKSFGLALLCRSVSNFTGALTMARDNQAMECLMLVRSCFENVLLVAGLCERGAEFVKDMRSDDAANLKAFGKLVRVRPDVVAYTDYIEFVDAQARRFLAEYADKKPNKLSLAEASEHFFPTYCRYTALSHDPAHVSLSALARHFSQATS